MWFGFQNGYHFTPGGKLGPLGFANGQKHVQNRNVLNFPLTFIFHFKIRWCIHRRVTEGDVTIPNVSDNSNNEIFCNNETVGRHHNVIKVY